MARILMVILPCSMLVKNTTKQLSCCVSCIAVPYISVLYQDSLDIKLSVRKTFRLGASQPTYKLYRKLPARALLSRYTSIFSCSVGPLNQ